MTEPIKPPLTPEEWAEFSWKSKDRGMRNSEIAIVDNPRRLWVHDGYDQSTIDEPEEFHAVAALALHGQPFGFTWEDVDMVRAVGDQWAPDLMLWYSLADRIAALLPPREGQK